MTLSEVQLKEIEELAGLFLEPDEIAILLDLDLDDFKREIRSKTGQVFKHYFKGKTESKKAIHENVVKMARHGSPQAEETVKEMIYQQELAERRG